MEARVSRIRNSAMKEQEEEEEVEVEEGVGMAKESGGKRVSVGSAEETKQFRDS